MNPFPISKPQPATVGGSLPGSGQGDLMARRTAASHASFALPLLRPGMRILDAGCGSGSITLGLAERVRPGGVIGIDLSADVLDFANQQAADLKLNAAFIQANVHELPFGPAEFDGVFAHALLGQIAHPLSALRELFRVMKPGAFIAVRSQDLAGLVLEPSDTAVDAALESCLESLAESGAETRAGRRLAGWLRTAGFHHVTPSAGYEMHPAPRAFVESLVAPLARQGREDEVSFLRNWAERPVAMAAQPWFEAVGWKPWG